MKIGINAKTQKLKDAKLRHGEGEPGSNHAEDILRQGRKQVYAPVLTGSKKIHLLCSAIPENSAFLAKLLTLNSSVIFVFLRSLCCLRFLLLKVFFGCGLPLRLCGSLR